MKNLKTWLKQALFDSDRVVKLQKEVEDLKDGLNTAQKLNWEYFKHKALSIKSNNELKNELKKTKEQLRIQTEMYKNRLKQ
jgi:hypothetical protein